ncbi:MFS transporter [Stenotrophomonas lacuserhaii]|uniref:MFS transporter n=1 Tax=Stenotrophomonas lacuserhaii TaxID=2760084 RepID=UPI0032ED3359
MTAEPSGNRIALIALAIGSFGIGTSEFSSMGLMPLFAADLSVDVAEASHAITAYAAGVFVGAPLVTLAAARLNRRNVLICLMLLFALGNLISGLAQSLGMLTVGRFISGMPQGPYFGAGAVVASYVMGPGNGGKAFALIAFGMTVATVVGAPLGTLVGQYFGWQTTYLAVAVYAIGTLFIFLRWLPKSSALDGASVAQELASIRNARVWALMGISALCVSATFSVYTFIGPIVTEVAGQSQIVVPVGLALVGLGMAVGTPIGGRMADRYEYRGMVYWFLATLAVMVVMGLFADNISILMVTLFAIGVTLMAAAPTIPVRMTHLAPNAPTMMGALNMAAFNVANALGAMAGSTTIAAGMGYVSSIWAGFAMTAAGLLLFALLYRWLRGGGRTTLAAATQALPDEDRATPQT